MPTPKRTKRGIKDPRIMHSLATLYARDHRKYNPHAIAAYFIRNPEAYCKKSTENGEPRIPSESTIRAAAAGKPIEPYFHECIKSWIRNVDPDLMPRGLRWVDLDLPGFFGSSPNKMAQLGKNLQGHYQTFSPSITVDDYIRCGRMTFTYKTQYDPVQQCEVHRILVEEEQYRPQMGHLPERHHIWRGHCAPRGNSLFMVMRCEDSDLVGDGRAILGVAAVRAMARSQITSMHFNAQIYEPERAQCCAYTQILVKRDLSDIKLEFTHLTNFDDDYILGDLWRRERKTQLLQEKHSIRTALADMKGSTVTTPKKTARRTTGRKKH